MIRNSLKQAFASVAAAALVLITGAPTVSAASFSFGSLTPTSISSGTSTTISISYSGSTPSSCTLYMSGVSTGAMSINSTSARISYTGTFSSGTYSNSFVTCIVSGATYNSATYTIYVSDNTSPSVGMITPNTATQNTAVTLSASFSDNVGVTSCNLFVDGADAGAMTISGTTSGTAYKSYTFTTSGYHTVYARCSDGAGNTTYGTSTSVSVSTTSTSYPTVGTVYTPNGATGQNYFTVTYSDDNGVNSCTLYVDGVSRGQMSLGSSTTYGTAYAYVTLSYGSHTAYVSCTDISGNTAYGSSYSFTGGSVTSSSSYPTVGAISPSSVVQNTSTAMYVTYSDDYGVSSCDLYVDGVYAGPMTMSNSTTSGTAYRYYTFTSTGSRTAYARCTDTSGQTTYGSSTPITVSSSSSTSGPTIYNITPTTATLNVATTIWATLSSSATVSSCYLYANNNYIGAMSVSGSSASFNATFNTATTYTLSITCTDVYGRTGTATSTVSVSGSGTNSSAPYVAPVWPTYSTQYSPVTFSVTVSDVDAITACWLYVNDAVAQSMSVYNGYTATTYTFTNNGAYKVQIKCQDGYGNVGYNSSIIFPVTEVTTPGTLVKTQCSSTATVNDPCTTVYYVGADGYRHAFPNEKVYKTWYNDYSAVTTVSASYMASLPLGKNVTYRPGVKLVKFMTSPVVYAVSSSSVLRPIASQDMASYYYGTNWNTKIDDIADTFYGNYSIGTTVSTSNDYSVNAELGSTVTINGNL